MRLDLTLTAEQRAIDDSITKICARFGDDYWSEADEKARFPEEFYRAMADAGWLGICMPQELGGAGLGVTEAAIMMHAVARGGGGYAAASSHPSQHLRAACHRGARHRRAEAAHAACR